MNLAKPRATFVEDGLHTDVHGDGNAPGLLLVHGFLSSRAQWTPNLHALAAVSTPVVVELLGHGRSHAPTKAHEYSVARYLQRLEAIRKRLGLEHWFVCGQSFGAGLTLRYAIEHPHRVLGQAFTNSLSALSMLGGDAASRMRAGERIEHGGRTELQAMPAYPKPSRRLPEETSQALLADAALLSPVGVANALRATLPGLCVVDELHRLRVPGLLVNGARETKFQPLRDLASRKISALQITDVADGSHAVNLDAHAAFNAALIAFMQAHAVAATRPTGMSIRQ